MQGETVLLAGGAGYIGNHTTIEIVAAGYSAVIIDNLVNSSKEGASRVEKITGTKIPFYAVDLLDTEGLRGVFKQAVGESCQKPLEYYENNFSGTINLLKVMREFDVKNIIFSSSATVYGTPQYLPIDENHPAGQCTNPYGRTKYFVEQLLTDLSTSDESWNVVLLRYFNPVGAHKSGLIGEDPQGPPNNLMPYVAQVAVGRRSELCVYGNDYNTPDGTGVRDYIHVVDLATGHVAAIKKLHEKCRHQIYNLGTGVGYSVLDMIKAFEQASGRKVPYRVVGRRAGDVDEVYADVTKAKLELGWTAERGLDKMCEDLWHWQSLNPKGFEHSENGIGDKQSSL